MTSYQSGFLVIGHQDCLGPSSVRRDLWEDSEGSQNQQEAGEQA